MSGNATTANSLSSNVSIPRQKQGSTETVAMTQRLLLSLLIVVSTTQRSAANAAVFSRYAAVKCDVAVGVCATSPPSQSLGVKTKIQCVVECQHRQEQSSCVGVNYRQDGNVCELFDTDPTTFSSSVPGCQYIKVSTRAMLVCVYQNWKVLHLRCFILQRVHSSY